MKKSSVSLLCLLAFVFGTTTGYFIGLRKGLKVAEAADWGDYIEHAQENGEFEARAYLHCLQALDSGDITNLHDFALGHVKYYVWDVQQLREQGLAWAPHIQSLYSNATIYVAGHPQKESEKTKPPTPP